ncbi:MAG: serine/threonine protein kinase, partial [Planctomycetes bacterium]|nr:serine/threonine protein kinase [Planctomycetota bacterium]
MAATSSCPSDDQVKLLALGDMPPDELESLVAHMEGCPGCVLKVKSLGTSDTLIDALTRATTINEGPDESVVTGLIERLSKLTQTPHQPLQFSCPHCGKGLKCKPELAGRKVKCPQCRQPAPVPELLSPLPGDGLAVSGQGTGVSEGRTLPPADRLAAKDVPELLTLPPRDSGQQQTAAASASQLAATPRSDATSADEEVWDFLAPPEQPDEIGRLGPYRVLKVLGAGGMGVVFQAEDPQLGRMVALKAMLPALAASPSAKKRFLREAKAAAAIKHDHIVTIHQVGEDRGAPFLAMEFLEGEPLDKRLEQAGKLPIAEVLRIGREMAEGLEAAHERGLIHRDIKPGNVWLEGRRARVKILDFGLARAASEESQLTQTGAIVGTPAFMAPEQAAGRTVDRRCDLFSLGCVLYRLTTGVLPFKGTDTISTLMAVSTEEPPSPSVKNPAVPQALANLIMQLLAKRADDRPASAQAVADALAQLEKGDRTQVDDLPAATSRKIQSGDGRRTPKSRRKVALIAGVLTLAAAIVAAVVIMRVQAPGGEFILEVDDDQVAVAIDKQGGLKLIDKTTGREFLVKARQTAALPAGDYELTVADVKAGLEFSTRTFTIKGADAATRVKVWFKGSEQLARLRLRPTRRAPMQVNIKGSGRAYDGSAEAGPFYRMAVMVP